MRNPISSDKIIVDKTRKLNAATRAVRDQRARLSSSFEGEPIRYELDLLKGFAENQSNARFTQPLLVTVVAAMSVAWVGFIPAIFWAVTTILAYLFVAVESTRFLAADATENDLNHWKKRFLLGQIMVGLCWVGYAAYGDMGQNSQQYMIIQFSTILVFQAMTAMSTYSFGQSLLITAAPATLVLAIRFFFHYDPASLMMAGTVSVALTFFYLITERYKLSVLSILESKAERETLIGELETAKSMSEEARLRAEEANMAKSRFLATMSHELRTPLNAILGFSEVMKDEVLGPIGVETYKDYVKDIHSSGSHLLNLINEILDLSRIEAGKRDLVEEAMSLTHAAEDACHMMQMKVRSKNVKLETSFHDGLNQIWADERAMRQIVLNLLSNALKFTPNGGTITVKVGLTSKGGQYVSIQDTGPGIPEDEIPIVLSSFGQGSIAIKSAEQGTGLGLPIVQALVKMHDGTFTLKSKLREGTQVIVTFPQSRVLEVMAPTGARSNEREMPPMSREMSRKMKAAS